MQPHRKLRLQLQLQGWTFLLLLLTVVGLLGGLSLRYNYQADWTASGRHTLSAATVELLERLDGPVTLTAFSRDDGLNQLRARTEELVSRYQRLKGDITLEFVDPDMAPGRVEAAGVTLEGELVISYAGRQQNLKRLGEQALTNALQRLARSGERRLYFLTGHGERQPDDSGRSGLQSLSDHLKEKGVRGEALNLTKTPGVPTDASALVLASPRSPLLAGEVQIIDDYLVAGGNLLWLTEPEEASPGLEPLIDRLGISLAPGTLLDTTGQLLGIGSASVIVVPDYPAHPVSEGLTTMTLFPLARAISALDTGEWQATPLLNTLSRAWSETGPLDAGEIRFDDGVDLPGPLTLGLLLQRAHPKGGEQRVVVIGDGDFLSNAYLGNGANLALAERLVNWLSHDDSLITIAPRTRPDTRLELSKWSGIAIGLGFLVVLPMVLLVTGITVWRRRRAR